MKAVLALIAIYVVAFIIATQGSQNPVQASATDSSAASVIKSIDPDKAADVRSLLELVGAQSRLQAAARESANQYHDKLAVSLATEKNDAKRNAYINEAVRSFQKYYDQQRATEQMTAIFDKRYSSDEVKGLLQFFSSPLGRKFAANSPAIEKEILTVQTTLAANATREALESFKAETTEIDKPVVANSNRKARGSIAVQDQMHQISSHR